MKNISCTLGRLACAAMILATPLSGCVRSAAKDFVNEDLNGRIGDDDWVYKHAYIDPTIETPEEDDLVFVFLPYVPKKPCPKSGDGAADRRSVMIAAPKARKLIRFKRGGSRSLVFQFTKQGQQYATVAKTAKIQLTSISDRVIKGRVYGWYSDDNWVSGRFSAVVCDYGAFQ